MPGQESSNIASSAHTWFPPSASQASSPAGPTDPAELAAFLDGVIIPQLRDAHVAGATLSLVRDGNMRAIDVGPLRRARELEALALLSITLFAAGRRLERHRHRERAREERKRAPRPRRSRHAAPAPPSRVYPRSALGSRL